MFFHKQTTLKIGPCFVWRKGFCWGYLVAGWCTMVVAWWCLVAACCLAAAWWLSSAVWSLTPRAVWSLTAAIAAKLSSSGVAARPEGQSKYTDHKSNKKKLTDKAQHTEGEGHKHKRQNAPHDLYQHMYRTNQQKPPTTSIFNVILFLLKYATLAQHCTSVHVVPNEQDILSGVFWKEASWHP